MTNNKNLNLLIFTTLCFLMASSVNAQTSDLFRVEYLYVPNSNSGSSIGRFRTLFQLPIKIKPDNYLIFGGEFRYTNTELTDLNFGIEDINSLYRIEATAGYLRRTSGDWIFAGKAGFRIASNLEGKAISDDYIFVSNIFAIRDRTGEGASEKPNRLILGLEYTTTAGRNFPLPIVNYYREFHPNWTYTLGVPKTNIRYKFDDKNHIQAFATLDNEFANIQNNVFINDHLAENVSITMVLAGLGYEHYFTEHILYYGYLAHSIINDYRFRDNEREDIYVIDNKNTFYFRTGLKLKI